MTNDNRKISGKCKLFLIVTVIIRCILQMGIPIIGDGNTLDDDVLMAKYAESLLRWEWLGTYSAGTLNKVPGFSIFLAVSRLLNIPFSLALGIIYCTASLLFFFAIRKIMKSDKLSLLIYCYILFSPAMMQDITIQRVYRTAIIPGLVLAVISCYLAIFCERKNGWKRIFPWSLCGGFFFAWFYITREDSIWLGCFVLGAIILIVGCMLFKQNPLIAIREKWKSFVLILLPALMCMLCITGLKAVNYHYYGLFETTDFKSTYFAKATKDILRIKNSEEIPYVWVTRDTIERLYEVSPEFAKLQYYLDDEYKGETQLFGSGADDGEIEKDYIIWAIRWSARDAGIYDSPQTMDAYFKKVYEEIEAAFADGRLEKNDKLILSNLARPTDWNEIIPCIEAAFDNVLDLIAYKEVECSLNYSSGDRTNLKLMNDLCGGILQDTADTYVLQGWGCALDEEDEFEIFAVNGEGKVFYPLLEVSNDVFAYLQSKGYECPKAIKCRFLFELDAVTSDEYTVFVLLNGNPVYEGAFSGLTDIQTDKLAMNIDQNGFDPVINYQRLYYGRYVKVANFIIRLYRYTGILFAVLAMAGYLYELIENLFLLCKKRKPDFSLWLIKTGLLLTIFADAFIVSFNYFANYGGKGTWFFYTGGIYPIWQMFVCLSGFYWIYKIKNKREIYKAR